MVITLGGAFGGWSLYAKDGRLVSDDHAAADSAFSGTVAWVCIDLDALTGGVDPVPPEDRLRVALARQQARSRNDVWWPRRRR